MDILVISGTVVAFSGLIGLGYCIFLAVRAKRAGLPDAEMKARLQKIVVLNLGALLLSAFGLMMVVVGVLL